MGYHTKAIKKGKIGEFSKVEEEIEELYDAKSQGNPVMVLIEITDLIGALDSYARNYYNIGIEDLIKMTKATQSAFIDGTRK